MNEIIEGNKLIADFLARLEGFNGCEEQKDPFKYHSSWDWLMPVVEKIEKECGFYISIEWDYITIYRFHDGSGEIVKTNTFTHKGGKIQGVYEAVIEFIKWYNTTK